MLLQACHGILMISEQRLWLLVLSQSCKHHMLMLPSLCPRRFTPSSWFVFVPESESELWERQEGSRLSGQHLNQRCHTTCIPLASWLRPGGCLGSGHPSFSLYLLLHSASTPLMSPHLNVCFPAAASPNLHGAVLMDAQMPAAKSEAPSLRRETDVCVHKFNIMRLLIFQQGMATPAKKVINIPASLNSIRRVN